MARALIALHFQNDICHPDGRVPFAVDRSSGDADSFLSRCRDTIAKARASGWMIVHVHIAFAPDYSDLPRNCSLFRAVETLGAVKEGSWGAAAMEGFEPVRDDVLLTHRWNNAFQGTGLERMLEERGIREVAVMGLATQYSVEHTVRHAADLGYAVTMLRDCCGSANPKAAEASFAAMAMLADVVDSSEAV
ncbi:cysteine hydrolase [Pseudaminobacter sp. 19-2017]|uniref:Cysteine hydrolase n=1 Tax=Pseudaminobacter soli (ex Zhang et al. 2022) TaxID=2831468 RepID=A0A942DYA9_9HYPH|nr:cysteine hydrolase [Pseudaminobacter soli]MBS3649831.1 cysteine hydrolase [Pseudaminobacter soli]